MYETQVWAHSTDPFIPLRSGPGLHFAGEEPKFRIRKHLPKVTQPEVTRIGFQL